MIRLRSLLADALSVVVSTKKSPPDVADIVYGPHERNVLDLWKAPGSTERRSPVVVFFHGGGFVGGDKDTLDPSLLDLCLRAGISVASANYRLSSHAPFPAPMLDGARAIQFLRFKANEWGLDRRKVAAVGNSAGAGIALWVGFHDNMDDPGNPDPVLRQSTRLLCIGVFGAQSSYDPRFIKDVIGGRAFEHPVLPLLYGLHDTELDSPRAYELYERASPINYVSAGAPPVFMYYTEPKTPLRPGPHQGPSVYFPDFGKELPGYDKPGWGIHHPKFGEVLKNKLDPLGIECVLRHQDDYRGDADSDQAANRELVAFLQRYLVRPR